MVNSRILLNNDAAARDKLIFGRKYNPAEIYDIKRFENLSLTKLKKLIAGNFLELTDAQNAAPSIGEIYAFMKKYPKYKAHGYVVSINRSDYRVSLEGVEKGTTADSLKEMKDFAELFKDADDFNAAKMYCWFD